MRWVWQRADSGSFAAAARWRAEICTSGCRCAVRLTRAGIAGYGAGDLRRPAVPMAIDVRPMTKEAALPKTKRCAWSGTDPLYVSYHDEEWGVPVHDDERLFEF